MMQHAQVRGLVEAIVFLQQALFDQYFFNFLVAVFC